MAEESAEKGESFLLQRPETKMSLSSSDLETVEIRRGQGVVIYCKALLNSFQ